MSALSLACRNMLLASPEVKALVADGTIGKGVTFPTGWVFDSRPHAKLEPESHKTLVVISEDGTWNSPNEGNTLRFPRLNVDVWAVPTKDSSLAVVKYDAEDLVATVFKAMMPYLHTVHKAVPSLLDEPETAFLGEPGGYRWWGTPAQVADKTAIPILSSEWLDGPDIQPSSEGGEGAVMGRASFGVML